MATKIGDGYLEIEGRPNKSQIRKAAEESGKTGGNAFGGVFGKVASVALKGAMGVALAGLAAQAGSLGVQLLGMIPALSSIASLSALLPVGIIGMIAAVGVLKAALSGVGDAIGAAFGDDPAKFTEALKKLSPEARKFAIAVRDIAPALKEVQQGLQDAFFRAGLVPEIAKIRDATKQLAPSLQITAGIFGSIAAAMVSFTTQSATMTVIRGVIDAINDGLITFRDSFDQLAVGFRSVASVVLPLFRSMFMGISGLAGQFGDWMTKISESGQLQQWLDTAMSTLATLGGILLNVGNIIMSVVTAAQTAGGGSLEVFRQLTGLIASFLQSTEGMNAMVSLFSGIMAVAQALMPIIILLASTLATALGPVIQTIAVTLGPLLLSAIQAIAPAIAPLLNAFSAIIIALSPIIPVIGQLVALIAGVLTQVLLALAPIISTIATSFATLAGPVLGALSTMFTALLTALMPVVTTLINALMPILPIIVNVFTQLVTAVTPLIALIGQFLAQAIQALLPPIIALIPVIVSQMLPAFIQMIPAIMQIVTALFPLIPIFAQLLVALLPVVVMIFQLQATIISQLLPALAPLIVMLVKLVTTILSALMPILLPFIEILIKIATVVTTVVMTAIEWLITYTIMPLINAVTSSTSSIGDKLTWLWETVKSVWNAIVEAIKSAIARVVSTATGIANFVVNVTSYFINLVSSIRGKIDAVASFVAGLPGRILSAVGNLGSLLWNAGSNVIQGLINGISSKIGALKAKISSAAKAIRDALPFSPAKWGPLSGSGDPTIAGGKIIDMIAGGMLGNLGTLRDAAASMANAATFGSMINPDARNNGWPTDRKPATANTGPLVVFESGAIQVTLTGASTPEQAATVGRVIADKISDTLARANIDVAVRTL